eukprot:SAG22_NODE_6607_length_832_cov_0.821282_2_plen_88_part_00
MYSCTVRYTGNFLHVGHTHEVIDQVFAVISDYLRTTDDDVSTLPLLQKQIHGLLNAHHVGDLAGYRDFDLALARSEGWWSSAVAAGK